MHQTKKGNQWYFGMTAHLGVDSRTKLIHAVCSLGTESSQTRRWRELDSKFQFRATLGGLAGLRDAQSEQMRRVASEFVSIHCLERATRPAPDRRPQP